MTLRTHSDPIAKEFTSITGDCTATAVHADSPSGLEDGLMPLEAAAKTILVKANGLPAYWKATGLGPRGKNC